MAAILATVDIEDLATAKVKGIKDALTDLVQTQAQLAASSAALATGTNGVIAAMGASATSTGAASLSFRDYVTRVAATIPVLQQVGGGMDVLFQHLQNQKTALQGAAQLLTLYGGALTGVAQAAREGGAPLLVQAQALSDVLDAAKAGVVGLKEHKDALQGMANQLASGTPLTEAQADALDAMATSFANANREALGTSTALQQLAQQAAASTAAIKENYSSLTLLTGQLKEGVTVTQLQADALAELSEAAQAGNGFTKEQAAALAELSTALQAGVTLTAEQAAELQQLTAEYQKANAETLGYKDATEQAATAVEQLLAAHRAEVQEVRQIYEALGVLTGQMQAGTQATEQQIAAMRELSDSLSARGLTEYASALTGVADASARGEAVSDEHAETMKEVTEGFGKAEAATLGFKEVTQESIGNIEEATKSAAAMAAAFGLLGFNLIHLLEDSGQVAARVETLGVVLGVVSRNARLSAAEMEAQVEAMKKLGITTVESTEAVIKFVGAELKLTDASKVARAAQDLAVVGGVNSSQAFDRLTRSIEAQSAMMLRSFGIVTSVTKIYEEYADTVGKTVKDLSDMEKRQAFVNKILAEGDKVAGAYEASLGTAGKQMASFARYTEEAKKALGEALLPTMLLGVEVATKLLKIWLDMPPAVQTLVTALASGATAMTTFVATLAGAKFLGLTDLVIRLYTAFGIFFTVLRAGVPVLTAARIGFAGLHPAVLLVTLAIGALTTAWVYFSKETASHFDANAERLAGLRAETQTLDQLTTKFMEGTKAVQDAEAARDKLEKQAGRGAAQLIAYQRSVQKVTEENEKLARTRDKLAQQSPGLAQALYNERDAYRALGIELDATNEKRRLEMETVATAVVDEYRREEQALFKLTEARRNANADLQALQQEGPSKLFSAEGQTFEGVMPTKEAVAEHKARVAAVNATLGQLATDVSTQAAKIAGMKPRFDAANEVLMPPATRLAKMSGLVNDAMDDWVKNTKNAAERLAVAGKGFSEAELRKVVNPQVLSGKLAQVERLWDEYEARRKQKAKEEAADRLAVRNLVTVDERELHRYDELNKLLDELPVGTEKWRQAVEAATPILNSYAKSGIFDTGKYKALDETLRITNKYLADFVPQSTIDDFQQLETALAATKGNAEAYHRTLEKGASLIELYRLMSEKNRDVLGAQSEIYAALTVKLNEYTHALELNTAEQDRQSLDQARTESVKRYADQLTQIAQKEEEAARTRRDANLDADEAIYQSRRQLEDQMAAEKLKGQELLDYQTRRQIEEIQHRYDLEKQQRDLALADEQRAFEERILLLQEEIHARADAALKEREILIKNLEYEANIRHQLAVESGDPAAQAEAEKAVRNLQVAVRSFEAYKQGIREIEAAEIHRAQTTIDRERAIVAANKKSAEEISANQKTMVDTQIAQILKLAEAHTVVAEMIKTVWSSVAGAFSSGLLDMLKDGKTFTQGMEGLWKNNLEPALKSVWERIRDSVFSIMDEMLKGWINNLLKMKTATKAADILGGVSGVGGSGGAMSAAGGWGANAQQGAGTYYQPGGGGYVGTGEGQPGGGMRPSAGRAGVSGGVMGGVIGAQIGYGVGGATGSYGKGIASGAGSGAAAGAAFGSVGGPVGAAIGAGIGAVIGGIGGWFGAKKAHAEARKARDEYISGWAGGLEELKQKALDAGASMDAFNKAKTPEQVAKAIQDLEKAFRKLDEALAVKKGREDYIKAFEGGLDGLKKRAEEAGISLAGLFEAATPKELQDAIDGINHALDELEKKEILAKAKTDLATTYAQMQALSKQAQLVGYDLSKLYNAETIEEFNREQEKLNRLLAEQKERLDALQSATTGLATWATGFSQTLQKGFENAFPKAAEVEEFWKKFKEAQDRGFKGTALDFSKQAKMALPMEEFVKIYQEAVDKGFKGTYEELAKHLQMPQAFLDSLKKTAAGAQDEFQSLGITAAASFAAIVHETGDIVQAMNQLAPTLDQLIDAQDKWGLKADESFSSLIQFRRIIKDNQDVFNSISGLTQALKGLTDANALTEESFDAMGRTAVEKFNTLVSRTGDQKLSMLAMQPTLQALWEAQKKFGFSVDASTQKLIDQGIEQGLVGANMQSVDQKMLDVLGLIAQALGVTKDKLTDLGLAGETAGGNTADELERIKKAADEAGRASGTAGDDTTDAMAIAARRSAEAAEAMAKIGAAGTAAGDFIKAGADLAVVGLDRIIDRAAIAQTALFAMGEEGERAGRRIEIAAGGAAEGHSPTGIKAIIDRTHEAHTALGAYSQDFLRAAQQMEDAAAGVAAVDFIKDPSDLARQVNDLTRNVGMGDTFPIDKFEQLVNELAATADPTAFIEPTTTVPEGAITVQVTQEGAVISVSALDNANMDEAWRNLIMPAYMKHLDNNADQIAERTESAIIRYRRRVG